MIMLHVPNIGKQEIEAVNDCIKKNELGCRGNYVDKCYSWFRENLNIERILLTASGSQALEIASLVVDCEEGSEIIFSTYSFPSTINPFVIRGFVPVLVEINRQGNIDLNRIKEAVNKKTKAVVITNYAGWNEEISEIIEFCHARNILVVEDNAQGFLSEFKNKPMGTFGDIGILSFETTKTLTCGEGGAIIINNVDLWERTLMIANNGTTRQRHKMNPQIEYTWKTAGVNGCMSALNAAFLFGQLQHAQADKKKRLKLAKKYVEVLSEYDFIMPKIHDGWNASMFYILTPNPKRSEQLKKLLNEQGIQALAHYGSLRNAVMGKNMKYLGSNEAEHFDQRMIRLPLYAGMDEDVIDRIGNIIREACDLSQGL